MSIVDRFVINGVDYGPAGLNLVVRQNGLRLAPSGDATVGTGNLRLYKKGGGPTIRNQMYVEIDRYNTVTNQVVWRYFCGFVARRRTGRIRGTNIKTWELDLQDCNLLFYSLVTYAAFGPALHIPAGSFPDQVAAVFDYFNRGSATRFVDALTRVPDLIPGQTLAAADYQGRDALDCLIDIFTRVHAIDSTIRPLVRIIPDPTLPSAPGFGFGPPVLDVYDGAAPLAVTKRFSDAPDGTHFAILQSPEFQRVVESARLVQWQQAVAKDSGLVFTGLHTTSIGLYGNPFDRDGAWKAKPVDLPTDIRSVPAAQAYIQRKVDSTAVPRETLAFATFEPVQPGDVVAITWALEGLSEAVYIIASVTVDFTIPGKPVYVLELGARLLQLGDDDNDPVYVLPYEGDTVAPQKPGSFTLSTNVYNWDTGLTDLTFTWTAPPDADLDPDEPYYVEVKVNGIISALTTAALAWTIGVLPGYNFQAQIKAKDTSDNWSAPAGPIIGTSVAVPVPGQVTWPTTWNPINQYDPASNSTTLQVVWNASDPSEQVVTYLVTATTSKDDGEYTIPVDAGKVGAVLNLHGQVPGMTRRFDVVAVNRSGARSIPSTVKYLVTSNTPPVGTLLFNGSFETRASGPDELAAGWKLTLFGSDPGTTRRTNSGGATDGKFAHRLTKITNGTGYELQSPMMGIGDVKIPDDSMYVTLHYKYLTNLTDPIRIQVWGFDKDENPVELVSLGSPIPTALNTWTPYSAAISLSDPSITQLAVVFNNPTGTGHFQDAYVDNVRTGRITQLKDLKDGGAWPKGATGGRPASPVQGQPFFDTSLGAHGLPIWFDGTNWIDAAGNTV